VYVIGQEALSFLPVKPPTTPELGRLVRQISQQVGGYLERQGLMVRDVENSTSPEGERLR